MAQQALKFLAVIVVTSIGSPTVQLDDSVKPSGYDNLGQCWYRVATMIREVSNKVPVTTAIGTCITKHKDTVEEKGA